MTGIESAETGRRPTIQECAKAVEIMGRPGMVKYFPADAGSRAMIIDELYCMVPSSSALSWLTSAMVRRIGNWDSLKTLRAVLESRYISLDADRRPRNWADALFLDDFEPPPKSLPPAEQEIPTLLPAAPEPAHCGHCKDSGLLYSHGQTNPWQFCCCVYATRKREREPGAVDEANAAVAKLLRLSESFAPRIARREAHVAV
jgi:hypothetical protein